MTYPNQGDDPGRGSFGQGSYGHTAQGQDSYGHTAQGQDSYPQGTYGQSTYGQSGYGAPAGGVPCPPSNAGWAVAAILFFWPLSFMAMTRASQVYPLWASGNYPQAQAASASAKKLGVISIGIAAVLLVLYFVFIVGMVGLTTY